MKSIPELERLVKAYPLNTALMRLRKGDEEFEWAVAAAPQDNEESLRKHAGRWMPFTEFVAVAFNRPKLRVNHAPNSPN